MEYEELLERTYENLPEKVQTEERFEIPRFESFLQGNQTIIRNFSFVAEKLRRDPKLLMKYMTKELAAPGSIEGPRLILQGRFSDRVINDRLNNFVRELVLCHECKKPDTRIVDVGHGVKMIICEACGARRPAKV